MSGSDKDLHDSDLEGDGQFECHGCLNKGGDFKSYHTIYLCAKCMKSQRSKQGQFKKSESGNKKALQEDIILMLNDPPKWRVILAKIQSENKLERVAGLEMAATFNYITNKPISDLHTFYA